MKLKSLLIFVIFSLSFISVYSQDENLIQFSGVIRNLKNEILPDVHIINIDRHSGTTSNEKGMFSFIVSPTDSVLFRSVGYKNTLVIIPDSLPGKHYPRDVYMLGDTIHFAELKIFPWKTYEEFKVAFLHLELKEDDQQRAVKNIAIIKAQLNMDFEPDADLSYKYGMQNQYDRLYYAGQYPSIPIFNPLNWAKFFSALKNGDFRKDE
ncbi:MAG: hypothetical protein H6538_04830 [Bacteroidales bacterium]|nr:hypothetical protein [Bacteroidales bacterium]MCB9013754.1 hypothetical protein [Bacteroidales bacterium]